MVNLTFQFLCEMWSSSQSMTLSCDLPEVKNLLFDIKQDIQVMKNSLDNLRQKLDSMQLTLSAQGFGFRMERKLMLYVWKDCRSKPFRISSLCGLIRFLSDPLYRINHHGKQINEDFLKILKDDSGEIGRRISNVQKYISAHQIEVLKQADDIHACTTYDELLVWYTEDDRDDVVNALKTVFDIENNFSTYFPL